MLPVEKTPTNSTLRAYRIILPAYDTIWSHFRHYRTKNRKMTDRNRQVKIGYATRCALHDINFLVNNIYPTSKHNFPHLVNPIYYHFPYLYNYPNCYSIHYNYIDITILLSYCNYYNQYNITVTISIHSIDKNIQ